MSQQDVILSKMYELSEEGLAFLIEGVAVKPSVLPGGRASVIERALAVFELCKNQGMLLEEFDSILSQATQVPSLSTQTEELICLLEGRKENIIDFLSETFEQAKVKPYIRQVEILHFGCVDSLKRKHFIRAHEKAREMHNLLSLLKEEGFVRSELAFFDLQYRNGSASVLDEQLLYLSGFSTSHELT